MKSNLETKKIQIEIKGNSKKSKEDAVSQAFATLQKQVKDLENRPVIYMKPTDVEILELNEEKTVERFLFLFFPKERIQYFIRLKVEIEISLLDF